MRCLSLSAFLSSGAFSRKLPTHSHTSPTPPLNLFGTSPIAPDIILRPNRHRAALEASARAYLASHFSDGTTSVFSCPESPSVFIIQIIANRYNPSNFWYVVWVYNARRLTLTTALQVGKVEVRV